MAVYAYVRYSDVGRRHDLRKQKETALRFVRTVLKSEFGGFYQDTAASAFTPLGRRDSGSALAARLERGDVVVVPSSARSFLSVRDMVETVQWWSARGVRVLVIDLKIDSNKPGDRAVLDRFLEFDRWHQRFESNRYLEKCRVPKRGYLSKFYRHGAAPVGWKRLRLPDGTIDLVPFEEERAVVRRLLEIRQALGNKYLAITRQARDEGVVSPRSVTGQPIDRYQVTRYIRLHAVALADRPPKPVWSQFKKGLPPEERRRLAEELEYDRPDRQAAI